jgi:hypothetical protein
VVAKKEAEVAEVEGASAPAIAAGATAAREAAELAWE